MERQIEERPTQDTDPGECRWCFEEAISGADPCPYHGERPAHNPDLGRQTCGCVKCHEYRERREAELTPVLTNEERNRYEAFQYAAEQRRLA
jgi:hypothetical protein